MKTSHLLETPYQDGLGVQEVACLNLRAVPCCLGTIDAKRVKEEIRPQGILFKRDFAEAAINSEQNWLIQRLIQAAGEAMFERDKSKVDPIDRTRCQTPIAYGNLKKFLKPLPGTLKTPGSRLTLINFACKL
ncbi:MAG: hypothetical protein P8Z00_19955 [Anaerolineales bacterium]|jgi:hypothetical protein